MSCSATVATWVEVECKEFLNIFLSLKLKRFHKILNMILEKYIPLSYKYVNLSSLLFI